jgi:plastocyanin
MLRVPDVVSLIGPLACVVALTGCMKPTQSEARRAPQARSREVVITTVPLLTKELAATYPFLNKDFATNGLLDGKEVYEFMPSTITVGEGDTLRLTFINPEDDPHSFVMSDLSVSIPGQSSVHAIYIARRAGIFDFICAIPAHMPMMRGQLVVLGPRDDAAP